MKRFRSRIAGCFDRPSTNRGRSAVSAGAICALILVTAVAASGAMNTHAAEDVRFHEAALPASNRTFPGLRSQHPDWAVIREFRINAPFILVGLEKRDHRSVRNHRFGSCQSDSRCLRTAALEDRVLQKRVEETYLSQEPSFVSHIAKFELNGDVGQLCILYSIYLPNQPCADPIAVSGPRDLYDAGWDALVAVENPLRDLVTATRATHIVLISTGWNTPQWESVYNYRTWDSSLKSAAASANFDFRPVYVGFSWKSAPRWLRGLDAGVKSNDSSENGYVWGGLVLHRVINRIAKDTGTRVLAIGHSYGAKLVTSAVNSEALHVGAATRPVDIVFGLQAAFSANRFGIPTSRGALEFARYTATARKYVMTASKFDDAVSLLDDAFMLGNIDTLAHARSEGRYRAIFETGSVNSRGMPQPGIACNDGKISYYDASAIVNEGPFNTGGGAHSDVFDVEMATFLIDAIRRC